MANPSKILITEDGHQVDLSRYQWDDEVFSKMLARHYSIARDQALAISRSMRQAIADLTEPVITAAVATQILRTKLAESGLSRAAAPRIEKSVFVQPPIALSDNARAVLARRYLRKDDRGNPVETPADMFRRVARHVARAEKQYGGDEAVVVMEERFFNLMTELKFLPNSPTLMNAGRRLGQLAACFVLPVEDRMEGIFESLKQAAIIHKSGGGTGFSFSRLRPKNSKVGTTGGVASGPVSFMKIFNTATEQVKQGGTRRGANMAVLRVDHPDILEFIHCKQDNDTLNNFNISVAVTDVFMEAVNQDGEYDLIDPRDGGVTGRLKATEVYDALILQAWKNGDPGILFLDRVNRDNPTPALGDIESTNPCGEQPLLPMEACNLGSINLDRFVVDTEQGPAVDYDALGEAVGLAVRFLDDTIDVSRYPLPEIERMVKGNRKIGLGVMGFADMLYRLAIPYNSPEALACAASVMAFTQETSHQASRELAEVRGVFENHPLSALKDRYRNATTTTIAPTGTLSIIANCSSGIEPLFALSFVRRVMDDDQLLEVNPHFEAVARQRGFYTPELMDRIAHSGSIKAMEEIPEDVRQVFVTAHDISPEWHVRMQAVFQEHTDNAVSKTVNLPKDSTVEDVRRIFDLAFMLGCKGVTIYRDGSKANQVLSVPPAAEAGSGFSAIVRQRPETLDGFTTKIRTGMGQLYVTVTEYEGRPFEIFATIGKSGRSTTAKTEAIGRLVSLALRSGVTVDKVIDQLKGIGGEHPVFQEGGLVLSIPDAIARVLERRYLDDRRVRRGNGAPALIGAVCPECGQTISFEEGCMTCHFCGYSKCG